MKIGVISDTHWSARKSSRLFHDYFELFYKNVFFPTLEQYGITTVIHMGDAFDSRKSIDFWGLDWTRRVVLEPLSSYNVHMVVGNHDIFLRNSNKINSPELLLSEYKNIKTYSKPTEIKVDNLDVLLIPWINSENQEKTFKLIQKTKCQVAMGHLELNGFRVNSQIVMDHGMDGKLFDKFSKVFSGHYHTRSDNGKIFYIGNPYEMFWSDVKDHRGFTIFDTESLEHFHINNPYRMHYSFDYDENVSNYDEISECENKIVKIVVRNKKNIKKFEKFIETLYSYNPYEVKIVENFQVSEEIENVEDIESEDTLSILNRYITESEVELDKSTLRNMIQEVYRESCEVF